MCVLELWGGGGSYTTTTSNNKSPEPTAVAAAGPSAGERRAASLFGSNDGAERMKDAGGTGGASHSETAALFSKQEGAGEREEEGEVVGGTAIPSNTNSNKELLSRPDNWLAGVTFAACSAATRQPAQSKPPPPHPLTPEPWRGSSWNKHAPVSCWPLEATFLHISFLSFFLSLSGKQTGGVGVGRWGVQT